jgi:ElaB/YqjD/DUF883 family membrane-anchored ribosome-binding protein
MENQISTQPLEKTPEQIEVEMFDTRESLTEKVAALENQVMGTVQTAANTLTETVDAVKSFVTNAPETVSDTVEQVTTAVKESVERTFDISSHVQSHPWRAVGLSAGVGFLAGLLVFRERERSFSARTGFRAPSVSRPPAPTESFTSTREPGIFDELLGMVGRKVKETTQSAIDSASSALTNAIREGVPKLVDEAAKRLLHENHESSEQTFDAAGHRIYGR